MVLIYCAYSVHIVFIWQFGVAWNASVGDSIASFAHGGRNPFSSEKELAMNGTAEAVSRCVERQDWKAAK